MSDLLTTQPQGLSSEREAEIRAREAAAQPGDWNELAESSDYNLIDHEGCAVWPWTNEADMLFAYHARADIPTLLAEIDRLRALNDSLKRSNHAH